MTNSSAAAAFELEAEQQEQYEQLETVDLEEQYEQLGAAENKEGLSWHLIVDRTTSNVSQFFVDMLEDDCSPRCVPDSGDTSTECSQRSDSEDDFVPELHDACDMGSKVSVHVDIDEEDGDVYFSTHRQNGTIICQPRPTSAEGVCLEAVHADIDEDDDDVFFCVQKVPSDATSFLAPMDTAVECEPIVQVDSEEQTVQRDDSMQAFRPADCINARQGSEAMFLRPVICNNAEPPPAASQVGILSDLRGGRAEGVRKYLARKLTVVH